MRLRVAIVVLLAVALLLPAGARAQSGLLQAGAGRADITPKLGYYLGGWTRADRTAQGQHTRLYARSLVLQRGGRKVALVALDLFMVPAGLVKHVGEALADRGFSERNLLVSASHTHSGPGGYANFPTLNSAAPSLETITDPETYINFFFTPQPPDPQLYAFLVRQIATAVARADDDRARAQLGWGHTRLLGVTRNRSLEAHLADHGIIKARGEGTEADDPGGYEHTIDPDVDVLRVDKVVTRRVRGKRRKTRVPIGAWSNFADHGTVTKSSFEFYNADHHASAMRVFEDGVRRSGRVPARQEVVNVYGNSNEGDMSAGLDRHGPAASDVVGREEAAAMLRAWRQAGRSMRARPPLDVRWTRACFCGQEVEGEPTASDSQVGLPFLTGSEEERGPLHDITGVPFEDVRNPFPSGPHGNKLTAPVGDVPNVVPLLALRVGDRALVSLPGEGTKEMGARLRAAVGSAVAGSGITRVVVSGLANEFILYLTTPEEYDRQHYEGGNTHFGRLSSVLLTSEIAKLAGTLARGEPAPEPVEFDSTNGVKPEGPAYGEGAATGAILQEPRERTARLARATLRWQGGPEGLDRPVDRAFVIVERQRRGRWVRTDDDLGLAMLWRVDGAGVHDLQWEVPRHEPEGPHRFVVEAKRYRLVSRAFDVTASRDLRIVDAGAPAGRVGIALAYPEALRDVDLTARPSRAPLGRVTFRVGGRSTVVDGRGREVVSVRAPGGRSTVSVLGAEDRFGNTAPVADG